MGNNGIIQKGGSFNAKNVAVGEQAKIEIIQKEWVDKIKKQLAQETVEAVAQNLMEQNELKIAVQALLARSKTGKAIELLTAYFKVSKNEAALKEITMQSARFAELQQQENSNTIPLEAANQERAKIVKAVLQLNSDEVVPFSKEFK